VFSGKSGVLGIILFYFVSHSEFRFDFNRGALCAQISQKLDFNKYDKMCLIALQMIKVEIFTYNSNNSWITKKSL